MHYFKKINSIWFGPKILAAGGLFALILPLLLYLVLRATGNSDFISLLMKVSFVTGILILLYFLIMLIIELRQDKQINKQYDKVRKQKIGMPGGGFECQNCGNRMVDMDDQFCKICGVKFEL